jgi:hypothetical protein
LQTGTRCAQFNENPSYQQPKHVARRSYFICSSLISPRTAAAALVQALQPHHLEQQQYNYQHRQQQHHEVSQQPEKLQLLRASLPDIEDTQAATFAPRSR